MNQDKRSVPIKYFFLFLAVLFVVVNTSGQMRKMFLDTDPSSNNLCKLSFYSPSQGYVAFSNWIGFTSDSGRTFVKKTITLSNVDYNGYSVNLTFGFRIMGVKSFGPNTLLVYGDYGSIPAILYSFDGGNNFKLIFQSQRDPLQVSISNGVADMDFVAATNTGYAVDEDRILKTTDQGLSWSVIYTNVSTGYNYIQALDASNVFAGTTNYNITSKLQKTTNGGASWQIINLPSPTGHSRLTAVNFLNANTGWIVMSDNGAGYFYKTTDGGNSWIQLNNVQANPYPAVRMKFTDANTGFAVDDQNTVYKTSNGGAVWEPLQRDNNIMNPSYSTNDIQLLGASQVWAGWSGFKMLELSTNAGGIPLPRSYFYADTAGLSSTGNVALKNYSASGYTYTWLLNAVKISNAYNSAYTHDPHRLIDTIALIVSNGTNSDTAIKYAYFNPPLPVAPPPTITSFSPTSGATGDYIAIMGTNLYVNSTKPTITIGGVPPSQVIVYSSTWINAVVGAGATGNIVVTTPGGTVSAGTFTYIPPPVIGSFNPTTGTLGDTITITGHNFTGVSTVQFGDTAVRSFTIVSDSVIKATVWLGASGTVKVTRPSGTGVANGFIFIPPPAPAITNLSTFSGTAGTPVKIYGTHFYGTLSVKFAGVDANAFTVVSDNEIDAAVGLSNSGNVTVTTLFGSGSMNGFVILPPPVIISFSPKSGPIGTNVTINGSNFSPVAADNIVYFGSVKAPVISSTANQLIVQAPYGANYKPISVTTGNLTAYSLAPFTVASTGAVRNLTDSSFAVIKDYPSNGYYTGNIAVADFDGDGKPDLVNSMGAGTNISVLRNLCIPGTISFDKKIDLITSYFPTFVTACDVEGDGKLDILVIDQYGISAFKNTSSAVGDISFAPEKFIGPGYGHIVAGDLNGDGKPEIVALGGGNTIYVYGNVSTLDTIAFAKPFKIQSNIENPSGGMAIGDLDGDGRPDIAVVNLYSGIAVLRNTGTNSNLSFSTSTPFPFNPPSGPYPVGGLISIGDLDGDGKPDMAVGLAYSNAFTIFRNTSTIGNLSFDPHLDFNPGDNFTNNISIEDLDGDGKPELTFARPRGNTVMIYKNNSVSGNIAFNNPHTYYTTPSPVSAATSDLDLDGKPDIFTNNNEYVFALSVLHNGSDVRTKADIADTNYKIKVVNNTCINKNDGKIIVSVSEALGYTIKITGNSFSDSAHINGNNYERDNLPAGVYQVCFAIDYMPDYQQCFTLTIAQPKDLSVYARLDATNRLLDVNLSGSNLYTVNLNGNMFQSVDSSLLLQLQPGLNTLAVQTALPCQGIVSRTFFVPNDTSGIKLIPNPVSTTALIYIAGSDKQVQIEVLGLDGKIIEPTRNYAVATDRSVQLNVSKYTNGLYVLHVRGASINRSIKLVKIK